MSDEIRTHLSTEAARYLGLVLTADQVAALTPTPAGVLLDLQPRTVTSLRRADRATRAGVPALYQVGLRPAIRVATFAGWFTTCGWGIVHARTPLLREEHVDILDDSRGPYLAEVYSCEHHTTHVDAVVHVQHARPATRVTVFGRTDTRGPVTVSAEDVDAWPGSLQAGAPVEVLGAAGVRAAHVTGVAGAAITVTFDDGPANPTPWQGWDVSPTRFPATPADRLTLTLAGADTRGYPYHASVRSYRAGSEQWSGPASQASLEAAQNYWRRHVNLMPTASDLTQMLRAALEREVAERGLGARWESVEYRVSQDEPHVEVQLTPADGSPT